MGNNNPKLTPAEQLRQSKRQITRGIREIDRERVKIENQQKKVIAEIKKLAKQGQLSSAKVLAKDLVRMRSQVTKMYAMRSQLQSVEMQMATMKSTAVLGESLQGVTRAMVAMNKTINLPALNATMREFLQENQRMDLTEEMMTDAVEMAVDTDDIAGESDEVVSQVLSEIGVEVTSSVDVGAARLPQREENKSEESSLEARFKQLG
jgi:charged multivesicular body protein 2A